MEIDMQVGDQTKYRVAGIERVERECLVDAESPQRHGGEARKKCRDAAQIIVTEKQ
jgi:hypothetical protein